MKTKNCFPFYLVCYNFSSVPSIIVPSSSSYHPPLESHCTFINYPAGRLSLLILPPPPSSSFTATEGVRTNRQKHNKLFNGCTIIAIGPTNQPTSQSEPWQSSRNTVLLYNCYGKTLASEWNEWSSTRVPQTIHSTNWRNALLLASWTERLTDGWLVSQ